MIFENYYFLISIILVISIFFIIFFKKQNTNESKMKSLIIIFNLLSDPEQRSARKKIFEANREGIIDQNGKITDPSYYNDIEKVRSTLDLVGGFVKNGYVPKEPCLEMFMGIIIRCWKVLEKNIEYDRKTAGVHFKLDFEWLAIEAKKCWKKKYPNISEPELF
tara:strand:- start:590 stop:1078 length:489 start_codon:yes stop_codon:yes gene_type:complete